MTVELAAEQLRARETSFSFRLLDAVPASPCCRGRCSSPGIGRLLMSATEEEAPPGRGRDPLDYWSFNSSERGSFTALGYVPHNERVRRPVDGGHTDPK